MRVSEHYQNRLWHRPHYNNFVSRSVSAVTRIVRGVTVVCELLEAVVSISWRTVRYGWNAMQMRMAALPKFIMTGLTAQPYYAGSAGRV
jgi:hypothetical protein